MSKYFGILFFALLTFSCKTKKDAVTSTDPTTPVDKQVTIFAVNHGTSYGHCRGYCIHDQIYTPSSVSTIDKSRDTVNYKPKTWNESDVNTLTEASKLIDWERWKAVEETLGCPDCADGGAEYIEIVTGTEKKRVTFDAGATIPGFEALVELLRKRAAQLDAHKSKQQQN